MMITETRTCGIETDMEPAQTTNKKHENKYNQELLKHNKLQNYKLLLLTMKTANEKKKLNCAH